MSTTISLPRTLWRFYPWFIAAGLGVVIMVNIFMVYMALSTFPGVVVKDAPVGITASSRLPVPQAK